MPPDNATGIAPGADVEFPNTGEILGSSITKIDDTTFNIADVGVYLIIFNVTTTEAGQVDLTVNGTELPYTVVGNAGGNSQITGVSLVKIDTENSTITVRNPATSTDSITLTRASTGLSPFTANISIIKIS